MKTNKLKNIIKEELKKLINEAALCLDGQAGEPCGNAAGAEGTWQDSYVTTSCLCVHASGWVIHDAKDWKPERTVGGGETGIGRDANRLNVRSRNETVIGGQVPDNGNHPHEPRKSMAQGQIDVLTGKGKKINEAALCLQDQAGQPCGNSAGATGVWTNHYTSNSCLCIDDNGFVIHDRKDYDPGAVSTGRNTGMGDSLSTDDMVKMRDPRYRKPIMIPRSAIIPRG